MTPDREDVMEWLARNADHFATQAMVMSSVNEELAGASRHEARMFSDALTLLREEWLPMASAPKQVHDVLLLTDGRRVVAGHFAVPYENHPGYWATDPGGWTFHPIGWRPLPPLPDRETD